MPFDCLDSTEPRPLGYAGTRHPGVHLTPDGIDIAVVSWHASGIDLCLIDQPHTEHQSERRIALFGPDNGVWHAHVPGVYPGQRYGLRAHGPWDPDSGRLFNPHKLLLDPYARGLEGQPKLSQELFLHQLEPNSHLRQLDEHDSAPVMPYCAVVGDDFDWGDVRRPDIAWDRTVIYEAHVRGLTRNLPGLPDDVRGTYAGLAHPVTITYLKDLGITAIELLPIHATMTEAALTDRGLSNYWGYSTMGFFAPNGFYATAANQAAGPQAINAEVKGMIKLLHEAGLEVILDVVYNHTCESGIGGPTVCWRGLDNLSYYLHDGGSPANYADVTGTGNTLDFRRPDVVAMALDSVRYWAREYQVDGFRYDLAVTIARGYSGFTPDHPFLMGLRTDPELRHLKHIAEPWDMGPGGWQTGSFPLPMAAWNDQFRGDVRSFWLGNPRGQTHGYPGVSARNLATRLSGSADVFGSGEPAYSHGPMGSVNFITAHDGFTMTDLVTYEHKRNQANGENNQDGTNDNRSWNHGFEGPIGEAADHGWAGDGLGLDAIGELRSKTERNLFATLAFAAGVPMILAGDEFGRTQQGNNNAYCQDSAISWIDWELEDWQLNRLESSRAVLRLRAEHPVLRPRSFYSGTADPDGIPDLAWYDAAGAVVNPDQWHDQAFRVIQMFRRGPTPADRDALILINGQLDPIDITIAPVQATWELAWSSTWVNSEQCPNPNPVNPGDNTTMDSLSLRLYLSRP